jgi:NitT/TauT family transport system substrate-binding protein
MKFRMRFGAALLSFAVVATLAGAARAQTTDVNLRVGVIPITDVAPLYLGISKGFFKEEHLTIDPVPAQGGSAIVPAVISNDDQIGFSNVVSLMLAAAHGLPLQAVVNGSQVIADGNHVSAAVVVAGDGPVKTWDNLEGRTIAVNALNNIGDVTIKDILAHHGVNVSKVKFIELGFPEMPVALKQGRVDAIWANEPFLTASKEDGARVLFKNYDDYDPKLTVAVYFTTRQYAAQHPEIVARFARAMSRSLVYAAAHQSEARAMLSTYTKLDAATAAKMGLSGWGPAINIASLEHVQRSMITYGLLTVPNDLQQLIPPSTISGR